jgi:triacylglycerol lipase
MIAKAVLKVLGAFTVVGPVLPALALALALVGCGSPADPASEASGQEPPGQPVSGVVVVPGFGGSAASVSKLVDTLRRAGHTVVTVALPGDGTGDIAAMTPGVQQAVQQLTSTGAPVDVVGYSMGGLVARAWAKDAGGAGLARRILTVGTPNDGTETAALGQVVGSCPQACQQMVPGSAFLDALNSDDPTPDGPAWITVRSSDDEVVRPTDTVSLEGASNVLLQDVCSDASVDHARLVSDPLPLAIIVRGVGQQPWTTPGTGDCVPLRG